MRYLPVVLVATALAIALAANGGRGSPEPGALPTAGVEPSEPEPPLLVGRATETTPVFEEPAETPSETLLEPSQASPPDPVERGTCLLALDVSAAGGQSIVGKLDLWRIDAPENEHFKSGDQLQATLSADDGRYVFDRLPAGTYRVHAHEQRAGTEDPPAFDVAGVRTDLAVELPGRRKHRVFLRVVDERGSLVDTATLRMGGTGGSYSNGATPSWIRAREPKRPELSSIQLFGGGGWSSGGRSRIATVGGPRGFDLGLHLEDSRQKRSSRRVSLEVAGRSSVDLRIENQALRERSYLAVVVPADIANDHVFLPSGERAVDAGAKIEMRCDALLETDLTAVEFWRKHPIELVVTLGGYDRLETTFTLDEHDWTRRLTAASPD